MEKAATFTYADVMECAAALEPYRLRKMSLLKWIGGPLSVEEKYRRVRLVVDWRERNDA